ncbi:MAG: DedA family protein [Lachnospiraceae bacterium]
MPVCHAQPLLLDDRNGLEGPIDTFASLLNDYGMFALFFIILLEYACFPVSSEIVLPFAGAFAHTYGFSYFLLIPLSVLAGILGTSVCYFIGKFGGSRLLDKLTTCFPKTKKGIDASREKFEHYGAFAVCFGRIIPLCRTYIAFIAGSVKQPYSQFFSYSLLGITVWNCVLIGLGYFLKSSWGDVQYYYQEYKFILLLLLIPALALLLFYKLRRKK